MHPIILATGARVTGARVTDTLPGDRGVCLRFLTTYLAAR